MGIEKEIFLEYISMRGRGLKSKEVLETLRSYIAPLSNVSKKELADWIRNWEMQQREAAQASVESSNENSFQTESGQTADWLSCPYCGKKNRADSIFCYACGLILDPDVATRAGTRRFTSQLGPNSEYFGPDSVLTLKVINTKLTYELRPQSSSAGLSLGRSTAKSTMMPDIDLKEANAEEQGVSRIHMSFTYDAKANALQVNDLGSVNGSFINGQKLHPKEVRVLRDGDEIQLGHLKVLVHFHHPGDEVH